MQQQKNEQSKYLSLEKIAYKAERFFKKETNDSGYSTDGYVYLSNEIINAIKFANYHTLKDKSLKIFIFRMEVPYAQLEPDYDESSYLKVPIDHSKKYKTKLEFSLNEFKSCRISHDILLKQDQVEYSVIDKKYLDRNIEILNKSALNYRDILKNRTEKQIEFINSLKRKNIC